MLDPVVVRNAIIFSSLLSLLSTGLTLTYMTTKVPNFAHGSLATVGAYVTFTVVYFLGLNPYLGFPLVVVLSGLAALAMYGSIIRPLMRRGASIVTLMISTIGFELVLLAILNIYADILTRKLKLDAKRFILHGFDFEFLGYPGVSFAAPLALIIIVTCLHILLTKTKFGVAMRAAIENPSLASIVGINVELVYAVSWFLAGALAGLAGAFTSLWQETYTAVGSEKLPSIFAASILGGLSSIYGAVLGGILMGAAEVLGTVALARVWGAWVTPYRPLIPLAVMSVVLLISPRGLAGLLSSLAVVVRKRGSSS